MASEQFMYGGGPRYHQMQSEPSPSMMSSFFSFAQGVASESTWIFDELPKATIVSVSVSVSRPDAGDISPMLLSYTIEFHYKQELDTELNRSIHQFDIWKQSYLKTYADIDLELKQHPGIDSFHSGSTALTIIKQGEHLVITNVGDSRAFLATTDDGNLVSLQLTVDFKPNIPEEAERKHSAKGECFCLRHEPRVYMVWMPNGETPGLALPRAFGDYCQRVWAHICA